MSLHLLKNGVDLNRYSIDNYLKTLDAKELLFQSLPFRLTLPVNPRNAFIGGGMATGKTVYAIQTLVEKMRIAPFCNEECTRKELTVLIIKKALNSVESSVMKELVGYLELNKCAKKIKSKNTDTGAPVKFDFTFTGDVGDDFICSINIFYISSHQDIQKKMDGINASIAWLEEAQQMGQIVFELATSRTGREMVVSKLPKDVREMFIQISDRVKYSPASVTEDEHIFYEMVERYMSQGTGVIATFNTDLRPESEYIKTMWEDLLKTNSSESLDSKSHELERVGTVFINTSPLHFECPIMRSENAKNLARDYLTGLTTLEMLQKSKVQGLFTITGDGEAVYTKHVNETQHLLPSSITLVKDLIPSCSERNIGPSDIYCDELVTEEVLKRYIMNNSEVKFYAGLDYGMYPACIILAIAKINHNVYVRVVHEMCMPSDDDTMSAIDFAKYLRTMVNTYFVRRGVRMIGDPSGTATETTSGLSMEDILHIYGGFTGIDHTVSNDLDPRINAVTYLLDRNLYSGVQINPLTKMLLGGNTYPVPFGVYANCPILAEGLRGRYKYKELQKNKAGDIIGDKLSIVKNIYSHPQDALQYACIRAISEVQFLSSSTYGKF